tara:strand:+ start:212 stop:349 length:138 start_codon:yes stop_codon:yes gene_type:complete
MTDLKFKIDGKKSSHKEINSEKDFKSFCTKIQVKRKDLNFLGILN